MVPLVAGAPAAFAAISRALASGGPAVLTRVQTRLGIADAPISKIMTAVKESPVTAALVAWELGDAASEALKIFTDNSEEARALVDSLRNWDPPPKEGVSITNLAAYKEEMRAIDRAAAAVGGYDRLLNLRRVLEMDDSFFVLRAQLRALGSRR